MLGSSFANPVLLDGRLRDALDRLRCLAGRPLDLAETFDHLAGGALARLALDEPPTRPCDALGREAFDGKRSPTSSFHQRRCTSTLSADLLLRLFGR